MRNCSFLILLLVCIPSSGFAQQPPATNVAQPAQLLPGLGNHHHPIAAKSPEAQKFFDQGLALAWAFNRAEAERSFRPRRRTRSFRRYALVGSLVLAWPPYEHGP